MKAGVEKSGSRAEAPEAAIAYAFHMAHEVAEQFDRPMIVADLIGPGELVAVYGAAGAGKSAWVADLCVHLDAGIDWQGRAVERASVLYLAAERRDLTAARIVAMGLRLGIEPQIGIAPGRFDREGHDVFAARIAATMEDLVTMTDRPCRLVVIDTMARSFPSVDENSGRDMNALIDALATVARTSNAAVLIITHEGKGSTEIRGSTTLIGAVDRAIRVVKAKGDRRIARIMMNNAGPEGETMAFRIVGDGVVEHEASGDGPEPTRRSDELRGDPKAMLDLVEAEGSLSLDDLRDRFRRVKPGRSDAAQRKAFSDARGKLVSLGRIEVAGGEVRIAACEV